MNLTPKPLLWSTDNIAKFMGITFTVLNNEHNKYNAVMFVPNVRPECEFGLNTEKQAKIYCEEVLLPMVLNQYFIGDY